MLLPDEKIIGSFDEKEHYKDGVFDFLKFGRVIEAKAIPLKDAFWRQVLRDTVTMKNAEYQERVERIWDEIICPMCYRLNPHHATKNNGDGCHWCQEKEDWCGRQALKGER